MTQPRILIKRGKAMQPISICYCGNRGIYEGIFLSALSVANNTAAPVDVILLSMDLSDKDERFVPFTSEQVALLDRTLKSKNPESCARLIDVTELQKKYFEGGKNQKNDYTPYASIRLFLDLLDGIPDKVAYLDADVMCIRDFDEYFSTDIENYEFAAALDIVGHHFFSPSYCNSGTLLLNIKKIKESGLFERARKMIRTKRMLLPDQSALNRLAKAKLVLPYRFNEQRELKSDTVLKHFCMHPKIRGFKIIKQNIKQWHRDDVKNILGIDVFDNIYSEYDSAIKALENKNRAENVNNNCHNCAYSGVCNGSEAGGNTECTSAK